jgi:D-alanyl-lipoteichoic acid acyltransferase DltB (MBOAT superfamily)
MALFLTMALGGLWHGAGMTFVVWGAAHGIALGAHVLWHKAGRAMPAALAWPATFLFVALAWVVFRAPDFGSALAIYRGLVGLGPAGAAHASGFWPLVAIAAALAIIGPTAFQAVRTLPPARWIAVAATLVFVAVLLKVGDDANADFIYAQF